WTSALSVQEFLDLKSDVEKERKDKEFKVEDRKKRAKRMTRKKPLTVAGYNYKETVDYVVPSGKVFDGLNLCKEETTPGCSALTNMLASHHDRSYDSREEIEVGT